MSHQQIIGCSIAILTASMILLNCRSCYELPGSSSRIVAFHVVLQLQYFLWKVTLLSKELDTSEHSASPLSIMMDTSIQ